MNPRSSLQKITRRVGLLRYSAISFTTLSTVGFGDITPVSKLARTLATMEATTGIFYMAVMISRLVSLYSPSALTAAAKPDQES